jgi:hypothetical protein
LGYRYHFASVIVVVSVVCKRFTFQSSSLKPLGRLEPSVAGISYSENVCVFGVAWKPGTLLYSNLLKIEKNNAFSETTGQI